MDVGKAENEFEEMINESPSLIRYRAKIIVDPIRQILRFIVSVDLHYIEDGANELNSITYKATSNISHAKLYQYPNMTGLYRDVALEIKHRISSKIKDIAEHGRIKILDEFGGIDRSVKIVALIIGDPGKLGDGHEQ